MLNKRRSKSHPANPTARAEELEKRGRHGKCRPRTPRALGLPAGLLNMRLRTGHITVIKAIEDRLQELLFKRYQRPCALMDIT